MANEATGTNTSRRDFVWGGALAAAALVVSRSEFAQAAAAPSAADDPLLLDTLDGLLAFVVPVPDTHSVAQGMTSPTVGGVGLGIADMLAATIDQTTPFVPNFSATVAATLNALAMVVNPAAPPTFTSPFARLSFAEKAAVFQIMDGNESLKLLGGVLPPFVAFFCYSEAAAFDPATRRIGFSNALFPSSWHPENGRTRRPTAFESVFEGSADLLGVDSPAEKRLSGRRLRVTPGRQAACIGPANPRTRPTPAALGAGPPEQ